MRALLSIATMILLACLWNASGSLAAEPAEDTAIVEHQIADSPESVIESWTAEDLRAAKPIDPPAVTEADATAFEIPDFPDSSISAKAGDFLVRDATAFPNRLQGKVFFRLAAGLFTCSATLISSRYGNAVFTAGHCLYDTENKAFASAFVFAPGYKEDGIPLNLYAATSLSTTRAWAKRGTFDGDIGIATLSGTPLNDLGGARPIAFNLNPKNRKYTIYGYPGTPNPPYDGLRLAGCRARFAGRDQGRPRTIAAHPCYLGHGTSGGGWITGGGYLNSVSSYFYCDTNPKTCGYLFGPYFGKAAKKLYKKVGGSITPAIAIIKHPKRKTSKRKVKFRFFGFASTPLKYRCKFDKRKFVPCRARTSIRRLTRGKHTLRVKAYDQMGRRTVNTPQFRFVVRR